MITYNTIHTLIRDCEEAILEGKYDGGILTLLAHAYTALDAIAGLCPDDDDGPDITITVDRPTAISTMTALAESLRGQIVTSGSVDYRAVQGVSSLQFLIDYLQLT